jgi:hypothetical protein
MNGSGLSQKIPDRGQLFGAVPVEEFVAFLDETAEHTVDAPRRLSRGPHQDLPAAGGIGHPGRRSGRFEAVDESRCSPWRESHRAGQL